MYLKDCNRSGELETTCFELPNHFKLCQRKINKRKSFFKNGRILLFPIYSFLRICPNLKIAYKFRKVLNYGESFDLVVSALEQI